MKIGIDGRAAKWYRGTGIGTYTYELINNINKLDFSNDYFIFLPDTTSFDINLNNNFKLRNINVNIKNNFWDEVNIPNILKDNEVELYHVPQNGVGLPMDKKCKFIITLHDIIPYKMPETVSSRYLKIFNEELPKIISLCDGIITVSNFSKNDIAKAFNFPKDKIFVTYLSAEEIYKPLDKIKSKKIIEKKYGISEDFILYVGGFSPRKNIAGIIKAFAQIRSRIDENLKLVIAGKKGISYSIYNSLTEKLNLTSKVIFPGFISLCDMPYLYNSAKLLVYPSFYEGFGLPPLEAMACGTPVIVSNSTSLPEIFGKSSIMVNPHNTDALGESIYECLENNILRRQLTSRGFSLCKNLTWQNTALSTINSYKSVLKA
ncbi:MULTISPECIES: glycosyltransferase family 4 protein [Clostridium]|uniref:glycosyltransferase family 4 protein n=1 Tax=Clostridium TaxID=1485 RepID=UPI00069FADA9|nr:MULTISPECIES: glycosyltransferase family 1 protein [Clostridium]KOF56739.1 glycosyl transferase [Clostridium sp. DMHC 10]MCD2346681.1 glycosyltransferase family 4 protein [Clostridium guangxiense]